MTNADAFLTDILQNPEDDAPRLVFADWLEDHGDPLRAEFIRLQCTLASPGGGPRPDLRKREAALLADCASLRRELASWQVLGAVTFRRGFVEGLTLPADVYLANAGVLHGLAPLRDVTLTDCPPRWLALHWSRLHTAPLRRLVAVGPGKGRLAFRRGPGGDWVPEPGD